MLAAQYRALAVCAPAEKKRVPRSTAALLPAVTAELRMLLPLSRRRLLCPELRPSSPPVTTTAGVLGRGRGWWGFYPTPPVLQNPQDVAREGGVAANHGEQGWR